MAKRKMQKVLWASDDKDLLEIHYFDGAIEYCTPDNNPLHKEILRKFSQKSIETETKAYKFYVTQREQRFRDFNDNYELWRGFWRGVNGPTPEGDLLNFLLGLHENPQAFFKLKLSIFEQQRVKDSSNREWKSNLRKAQSALELLALLHQELPDLKSEQVEAPDEIFLQETSNLEDNQDSVQNSDDQKSGVPTE